MDMDPTVLQVVGMLEGSSFRGSGVINGIGIGAGTNGEVRRVGRSKADGMEPLLKYLSMLSTLPLNIAAKFQKARFHWPNAFGCMVRGKWCRFVHAWYTS